MLAEYQTRFKYIMVDEYQDTNHTQFILVKMLAAKYRNLCVVGDDDQSIYKFRGANIYNILNFEDEYPDAKVVKLEQNYRSKANILNSANAVIANNEGRKDKRLWTEQEDGEKVTFTRYGTEYEEANGVASRIKTLKNQGYHSMISRSCIVRMRSPVCLRKNFCMRICHIRSMVDRISMEEKKSWIS